MDVEPRVCLLQLNAYGFSKLPSTMATFRHATKLFVRGHPERLVDIRRTGTRAERSPSHKTRRGDGGKADSDDSEGDNEDEEDSPSKQLEDSKRSTPLINRMNGRSDANRGHGTKAFSKHSPSAETDELAEARLRLQKLEQQNTVLRETLMASLTTITEMSASLRCPSVWGDSGGAARVITNMLKNFVNARVATFPTLAATTAEPEINEAQGLEEKLARLTTEVWRMTADDDTTVKSRSVATPSESSWSHVTEDPHHGASHAHGKGMSVPEPCQLVSTTTCDGAACPSAVLPGLKAPPSMSDEIEGLSTPLSMDALSLGLADHLRDEQLYNVDVKASQEQLMAEAGLL